MGLTTEVVVGRATEKVAGRATEIAAAVARRGSPGRSADPSPVPTDAGEAAPILNTPVRAPIWGNRTGVSLSSMRS